MKYSLGVFGLGVTGGFLPVVLNLRVSVCTSRTFAGTIFFCGTLGLSVIGMVE